MRTRLRLSVAALALLFPAAALARWSAVMGTSPEETPALALPHQVGPWSAVGDEALDADILAAIQPDAYLMRRYEAPGRSPIWLYVGLYAGRAGYGKGAHDPQVCYPAHGWETIESEPVALRVGGGRLHARRLGVHQGTRRQAVLYWFQPAARWPATTAAEELWRVFDAVAGRPQYAFVRLAAPSHVAGVAEEDLAEFARQIALGIRASVEGLTRRPGF